MEAMSGNSSKQVKTIVDSKVIRDNINSEQNRRTSRKTSRNYVESDNETEQNSARDYVLSVGDELSHTLWRYRLRSDMETFGSGTWEWLKLQNIQCQTKK